MLVTSALLAGLTSLAIGWAPAASAQDGEPAAQDGELIAVRIDDVGQSAPTYRIEALNHTVAPVEVTLRLGIPSDTAAATVSSGGQVDESEITWRLPLPASGAATVNASFRPGGSGTPQTFPVCAYEPDTARPYDCAADEWIPTAGLEASDPWWQRPSLTLIGGLAALTLVAMIGYGWRRRLREHQVRRRRTLTPAGRRVRPPSMSTRALSSPEPPATQRWRPSPPMVFGLLSAMLLGLGVAGVRAATYGSEVLDQANQAPSGWIGDSQTGGIGALLSESAFEFVVYRLACAEAGGDQRRCLATVEVRNTGGSEQLWYGPLQRAYLPTGDWVGVDEAATREENGGRDIFTEPVPPDGRMLVPLAFTVAGELTPDRLVLRSGAFSAGVTVLCR
ncbi:hypothetical protein O7632_24715 [Solwaraspora sp. WMMD406]|uniref:hypothetical protein n=1 Tax=Solwaraspora sp. WMMD406 TaxID=3016095 RepID=UPI002415D8B0|nr:hypothetical protein [Solwaraspora sp. WMMD406]MDG4767270.1 hypothetical protein [Solwaraspora sp. WMMD406]